MFPLVLYLFRSYYLNSYGAAQLADNIRYGVSYLIKVSITNPDKEANNQVIEVVIEY